MFGLFLDLCDRAHAQRSVTVPGTPATTLQCGVTASHPGHLADKVCAIELIGTMFLRPVQASRVILAYRGQGRLIGPAIP